MKATTLFSARRIAGALLALSLVLAWAGASMYGAAGGGNTVLTPSFILERSLFVSAVIVTALGFVVLETVFQSSPARTTAHVGTMTYFFAAVLLVVAECLYIRDGRSVHPLIVTYVVLALLGEAAIGVALFQSNLLPA